jgi:hypothetical protein
LNGGAVVFTTCERVRDGRTPDHNALKRYGIQLVVSFRSIVDEKEIPRFYFVAVFTSSRLVKEYVTVERPITTTSSNTGYNSSYYLGA